MDAALSFDGERMTGDLGVEAGRLALDDGLTTAIVVSLFTDRRARSDDAPPDGPQGDRRGWWGDLVAATEGDQIGSRLWLLAREKQLPSVVARAREYAAEALAWLVEDGIAAKIEVTAEVVRRGVLGIGIVIHRPGGATESHRYSYVWDRHAV